MRRIAHATTIVVAAVMLAACGGGANKNTNGGSSSSARPVDGLLVVDGQARDGDAVVREPQRSAADAVRAQATSGIARVLAESIGTDDPWPAPPLLSDGTIDDGPDPFGEDEIVPVQPTPIEDDPNTTRDLDAWSVLIRDVDSAEWNKWLDGGFKDPFKQNERDPVLKGIVRISVERCGGAHTVATGAVVAPETVVTTVHAIESPSRRVRVAPALGTAYRIPAIVRYLDVDDDVAVLKVPGLKADPLSFYSGGGGDPQRAYAYGIARGTSAGSVRREPAVVATQEEDITVEQPDGFGKGITDREVFPMVGAIDSGFTGGVVTTTSDPKLVTGWAVHGLVRARVPYRSQTGGILVPARVVQEAVANAQGLDAWFEHGAGRCPQWTR
jgi:hypothetical protein